MSRLSWCCGRRMFIRNISVDGPLIPSRRVKITRDDATIIVVIKSLLTSIRYVGICVTKNRPGSSPLHDLLVVPRASTFLPPYGSDNR